MRLIIINILIAYVALLLAAYFLSDSIIFQPPRTGYQDNLELIQLRTSDGEKIFAYYLPNKNAKYTLLVSHGNARDLGQIIPFLNEIHDHGFSVFGYDYHGYGLSSGRPNEFNAYLDIEAAYNYLIQNLHISPENIISYGHSLGAAMALDLAVQKPVAAVILEAPFVTAFRVVTRVPLVPFDKFNNLKKIKLLKCPLLVIHGTIDRIIPFWHGKNLYDAALVPKQFYVVKNVGHNDIEIAAGEEYWDTISSFIKQNLTKK
ncbi:MAG: alpha/beta hydrolase [Gammaproteobacteria bacterium]|nr:alpha/beta hydrolase [Gammaproteobacteria bacterium]